MAVHTRYLVSTQGNRNLALDHCNGSCDWFRDFTDADTEATRRARLSREPQYVHVVTVRTVRHHNPVTTVVSVDVSERKV